MCASFLSPTHKSPKNGMPREYITSPVKQEGRGDVHCCRNVDITVEPSARATATGEILLVSQRSVWATCWAVDPLFTNVFSNHCFKPASTALSEKVSHTPKNTTLSCLLQPIDAVFFILFPWGSQKEAWVLNLSTDSWVCKQFRVSHWFWPKDSPF